MAASNQSGSSRSRARFESALQAYQRTTTLSLTEQPVAVQIQNCHSVEPITTILLYEARGFSDFRGFDRITSAIESTVLILSTLSATTSLGDAVCPLASFPPAKAIQAGLAILLAAANAKPSSYDGLVDLLESIVHYLNRLSIYTRIPSTPAMDEIIVSIMAELLSTLALATKELKQGRPLKLLKKRLGDKDVEAILQRLDRLTQDEARTTAAQILEVVYRLVQHMSIVMGDDKASAKDIQEALEILHQVVSEMNKLKRDKLQQDIHHWLSPPDPWKNYNVARESRHSDTGMWFVNGGTFPDWKASGPRLLLWIHGKPGSGKSVLCSTIIEEIETMRKSGLASLAMFFYDFREDQKKDLRGLLSSVLFQLCDQSDSYYDILSAFYSNHRDGKQSPSNNELVQCLKDLLNLPGQAPVYLIVDALDECPNTSSLSSPREDVLTLLENLIDSQLPNLRICVTSRPEADIRPILEPLSFRSVSLHDERGQQEDIKNYIKSVVNTNKKMRRWIPEHKQLVINVLTERADGMFRWAYCQLDYLGDCLPGRVCRALDELPATLDGTYERTLREIKDTSWEYARRLLLCVAAASRLLRVEELAEILAFDFETGSIPTFREDWRLENPVEAVLSTCSTLLSVVNVRDSQIVQFAHFSVKEFLVSTRFFERHDIISRRYHISTTLAHTLVVQACLGILLHLDENIDRHNLEKFPLAEYAAEYWVEHARFNGVSQKTIEGIRQLLDRRKPHLAVWLRICNPTRSSWREATARATVVQSPLQACGTPLHYAAFCGLHDVVEVLAMEQPQDVKSKTFTDESTPLHLASQEGHVTVARLLVEHGAEAAAEDGYGRTSLHLASQQGHVEVARLLVDQGVDVVAQDKQGQTPLHVVPQWGILWIDPSWQGPVEVARFLVEHGADVVAQDKQKWTPLHEASSKGDERTAQFLLEHGADVAAQNKQGRTPLHLASWCCHVKVAQLLIERDADVEAQDKNGRTPLHVVCEWSHMASIWDHKRLIRLLVEHGANVEAQDKGGRSPLHVVSGRGLVVLARLLIEYGADVTAQDKRGQSPLHRASKRGHMELVLHLVENGADVLAKTEYGWTPLHQASERGHIRLARLLVELGAEVVAQDQDGWTPLHLASERGDIELARLLVQIGADATVQDQDGWTPLHLASLRGDVGLARLLIEHGADVAAQDKDGWTSLRLASEKGHLELARLLVEHGADTTIPQI